MEIQCIEIGLWYTDEKGSEGLWVHNSSSLMIKDIVDWVGRWELIDGVPFDMKQSPSSLHQIVVGELFFALRTHFGQNGCSVYVSPFDVQLNDSYEYTIVQPDLSVFCNHEQVDDQRATGAPKLIVEVLSPSTALKDRNHKFSLYEKTGVKEYWLADPLNETIEVYGLVQGKYLNREVFGREDSLTSFVFPEIVIDLNNIFVS